MSGQWPPDWEDPDDGHADAGLPDGEHPDAGHSDLELSELTSFLASVHSPALPLSFEARISAAIAAEAAARATTGPADAPEPAGAPTAAAGAGDAKGTVRSANPEEFSPAAAAGGAATSAGRGPRRGSRRSRNAAGASGPGTSRPDTRRRRLRMPSGQAASWVLVCCLVLAGFGFLVTRGSSSSSSSVAAGSTSGQAQSPAAGTAGLPDNGFGKGAQPEHAADEPSASSSASAATGFLVYSTGTAYKRSTLASQVQGTLINYGLDSGTTTPGATTPVPADSASASAASSSVGGSTPSPGLSGCVSRVTDGATPSLVDKASYDGIPAYIIAVPTQAWVVRLGCTAADPELIVQIPLTG
jgi:hypothetical protein